MTDAYSIRAMLEPDPPSDREPRPASVRIQRRIEWSDTDASGAYHNTAAFRLMEAAETTLVERLGLVGDIYGRHPRAHVSADFLRPLYFRDLVDVAIAVVAVGRTSVTYDVTISRGGEACVRGRLVAVLMDAIGGAPQPWSARERRLFETAGEQPPELLVTEPDPSSRPRDPGRGTSRAGTHESDP
jgi:2-aminobenzoate-CoA ligase